MLFPFLFHKKLIIMPLKTFLIMISTLHMISVVKSENPPAAPALYVFGDSLFDSGNNNLLPTLAKANFPPYGMNFEMGATGRFTNGRTVVDFIAEFLGLPHSPPYLSLIRTFLRTEPLTGLNFASASCGILPQTGSDLGKCLNLAEQIGLFERAVKQDISRHYKTAGELSNYLSKSVFVISIGSNDYINNYLDTQRFDTSKHYTPLSFARLLVDTFSQQLERLYHLGARKVIIFEIGPIGCIPSSTKQVKHKGRCVEEINQLAKMFNNHLAPMLQNLTSSLRGSAFILGHAHWLGYDAVIHPSKYGLTDSSNACCVTWMNGTSACIPELGALACREPNKHYFWDGYHLTEAVYKTIATHCFNESSVCIPKNIKELVSEV
ncbi:UNVERIFIED_CONTAM: GDSL esterase/lipase 7 [Sesamum latifolium]|uniref:GDSL esterase/lipase 7 n=1 Tax=Sesamum latifolium TaxID=2727402 RepID=A0AAW2XE42_9LAMI